MKSVISIITILLAVSPISAQNINFNEIYKKAAQYTVSVNLLIEISFGTQTTEARSRGIGSIVNSNGLVMFDGTPVNADDPFSIMSGMQVSAEPKSIEVIMMDGTKYSADFIGVDRFTKVGFCRISSDGKKIFEYVKFKERDNLHVGEWLALYMLLPEYVTPQLSADIGMVSAIVNEPEEFVLTVGFNELELASILYDSAGVPLGVLGNLNNPAMSGFDGSGMLESFSQVEDFMPLLGLIGAEKLNALIENPPLRGEVDRGWLGIYLQALTPDIADFWAIESRGGIIVNEVVEDSPADSAGIETGDIIIQLSGRPITVDKEENIRIFQKQISEMGAGAIADLRILRRLEGTIDTLDKEIMLTSAPLSPAESPEYEDSNFEVKVRDMVFADYNIFNLDPDFEGVVVKEVEPGGWCAVGGILPGDIIQSIDGRKTASVDDAENAFKKVVEGKPEEVVFFIYRDSKTLFINIKTDW